MDTWPKLKEGPIPGRQLDHATKKGAVDDVRNGGLSVASE